MGQGACRSLVLKTNLGPVIHKSLVYQCLETLLCTSTNQEAPHFHPKKTAFIWRVMITDGTIAPLNLKVAGSSMWVIISKVTRKLHECNTALLFLSVLNWASGLTTVTVFRTLSILRPCSEKHFYLALVTGGSVFSSAEGVFLYYRSSRLQLSSFRMHLT